MIELEMKARLPEANLLALHEALHEVMVNLCFEFETKVKGRAQTPEQAQAFVKENKVNGSSLLRKGRGPNGETAIQLALLALRPFLGREMPRRVMQQQLDENGYKKGNSISSCCNDLKVQGLIEPGKKHGFYRITQKGVDIPIDQVKNSK